MAKIFISGSREIPFIPNEVKERIDRIIDTESDIVIGDSERGVDSNILRYLESRLYENISVYTVHDKPRAKTLLDAWNIRKIKPDIAARTDQMGNIRNKRELETAKDQAMGAIADFGLVVWQSTYINRFGKTSVSKGSLRNMHQLLSSHKPVVLYKSLTDDIDGTAFSCHELRSLEDLDALISSEPDIVKRAYGEIKKTASRNNPTLFD